MQMTQNGLDFCSAKGYVTVDQWMGVSHPSIDQSQRDGIKTSIYNFINLCGVSTFGLKFAVVWNNVLLWLRDFRRLLLNKLKI